MTEGPEPLRPSGQARDPPTPARSLAFVPNDPNCGCECTHGGRDLHRETSLRRNAARKGRARVPDVAIYATASRLEEPSVDEGCDELHLVESSPSR